MLPQGYLWKRFSHTVAGSIASCIPYGDYLVMAALNHKETLAWLRLLSLDPIEQRQIVLDLLAPHPKVPDEMNQDDQETCRMALDYLDEVIEKEPTGHEKRGSSYQRYCQWYKRSFQEDEEDFGVENHAIPNQ